MARDAIYQTSQANNVERTQERTISPSRIVRRLEEQEALDGLAGRLAAFIRRQSEHLPGGQRTIDFLNGRYIGHPLHPLLTDIPIGAFSFAAMFDVATIGRRKPSKAATALLAVGLASVPPTALAGALDWQHTSGKARRVGVGHMLMNVLASLVMGASLATRLRGRGPTRTLNLLGNAMLTLSAYLGGHLVYHARIGVRHDAATDPPEHYVPVMPVSDLREQVLTRAEAGGYPIVLYKRFGRVYALSDVCPHLGCSLSEGSVGEDAVVCGCHGSRFAIEDGSVAQGPSAFPVRAFVTRIVNGTIEAAPAPEA